MFLFRSGESLYGVGNAFVLGLFSSPASVGYYSLAERISRAIFGLMDPVRESIYPRLSHLAVRSQEKAARLAKLGAVLMIAGGVLLGAGVYWFAPLLIHLAGSNAFTPAVTVLRIFAILPPLLAITHSVGIQWLLAFGKDNLVNRIIMSAGVSNLALAVFLRAPIQTLRHGLGRSLRRNVRLHRHGLDRPARLAVLDPPCHNAGRQSRGGVSREQLR